MRAPSTVLGGALACLLSVWCSPLVAQSGRTTESMDCFSRSGDDRDRCFLRALEGRASTERELALLATVYWRHNSRDQAEATMRRYLQRFPDGPSAALFRERLARPRGAALEAPASRGLGRVALASAGALREPNPRGPKGARMVERAQ